MKTRIFRTEFWQDSKVLRLSTEAKLLFVYLITSPHIKMTNYVELPDEIIMLETSLTPTRLASSKEELEKSGRVFFANDWVYIPNAEKHNKYRNSDKNIVTYENELNSVPKDILSFFESKVDSSIHSSIDSTMHSSRHSNHKSRIINNKSKTKNQKPKDGEIAMKYLETFNETHGKSYTSLKAITPNLTYWLETYTLDQILEAVRRTAHGWWADNPSPELLLRRKNRNGEPVDYIGQLLNNAGNGKGRKGELYE